MSVRIITGDALTELAKLPAESVHCCVTSPPYFGLRDYGTASWDGGDPACDHTGVARRCDAAGRADKQSSQKGSSSDRVSRTCLNCGATRVDAQLGLEATPDEYVSAMVGVFREVRRVLRSDGTLFLNIGDSYASSSTYNTPRSMHSDAGWKQSGRGPNARYGTFRPGNPDKNQGNSNRDGVRAPGLKPKDLIGIPWMLAFALRADGWWLRQDIIWSKPNPMPESVTDRCTKAHEYLFLLSKSATYHYDAEAIKEPTLSPDREREKFNGESAVDTKTRGWGSHCGTADGGRNKRSVWTIATEPNPFAHFAMMPTKLAEPCIMAGCTVGGTVLDPFTGAGTTGLVADRLGRDAILIELNPTYADMAWRRIADDAGMFFQAAE